MPAAVLIIDDDEATREGLALALRRDGFAVETAAGASAAVAESRGAGADVVLLDLKLPDGDGLDVLRSLRGIDPDVGVLMITGYGDVSTAVEAMREGAADFVEKPFDLDFVRRLVGRTAETVRLRREVRRLRNRGAPPDDLMIGRSAGVRGVVSLAETVAASPSTPVLVCGETGVGKELVARMIHRLSPRCAGPFVSVDVTAVPETLAESELFGHEAGAFTDARHRKRGLVEAADGGTLFLDEIGDLQPSVQPKLLRFLETRAFRRVGGTEDLSVDVRVVAATHRELAAETSQGRFRQDLYYRLRVVQIDVPPLRERGEADVRTLAAAFVARFASELKRDVAGIDADAMDLLCGYRWPGNVRELKNVIERGVLLTDGPTIRARHLPAEIRAGASDVVPDASLDAAERRHILSVLDSTGGNKVRAARLLGISRTTLRDKLRRYGR